MPRVKRFISSKQAPVESFASAPSSLATQSTDIVGAIAGLGGKLFSTSLSNKKAAEDVRAELARKTQANVDFLKTNRARGDIKRTGLSYEAWKEVNNPDEWVKGANKFAADVEIDTQGMSPEAQQRLQQEIDIAKQEFIASSTLDAVKATGDNVVLAATAAYNEVIQDSNSTEESRLAARAEFEEQVGRNRSVEFTNKLANKLDEDAVADRATDASNDVYASIEAGAFDMASKLATNSDIPEDKQATLRSAINTAENKVQADIDSADVKAKAQATDESLLEVAKGEGSITKIDKRFELGLIERSEWKSMRDDLEVAPPTNSDPEAAATVRRVNADFESGAITRDEANKGKLAVFSKLDATDREKVYSDLEDIGTKIVGTAKTNAYSEGRTLISPQFVGVTMDQFRKSLLGISGLTDEEKGRINRRFQAEISNRDLYERAVDQRFREMRTEGTTDPLKYESESLSILMTYQRNKDLKLTELEAEIKTKQKSITDLTQEDPRLTELRKLTQ